MLKFSLLIDWNGNLVFGMFLNVLKTIYEKYFKSQKGRQIIVAYIIDSGGDVYQSRRYVSRKRTSSGSFGIHRFSNDKWLCNDHCWKLVFFMASPQTLPLIHAKSTIFGLIYMVWIIGYCISNVTRWRDKFSFFKRVKYVLNSKIPINFFA